MKFFCRIFGHTWVYKNKSPKTSWNTTKDLNQLVATPASEPNPTWQCARCQGEVEAKAGQPQPKSFLAIPGQ